MSTDTTNTTMTYDHTENKKLYCQDWLETDKPWERWEYFQASSWRKCPHHPIFSPSFQYRRTDPYAELKKAAQDPTKQIRCVVGDHPGPWKDGGDEKIWIFTSPASCYEVRDKPKSVKYLCYETNNGDLFWLREDNTKNCTVKRIPQFDKELTT